MSGTFGPEVAWHLLGQHLLANFDNRPMVKSIHTHAAYTPRIILPELPKSPIIFPKGRTPRSHEKPILPLNRGEIGQPNNVVSLERFRAIDQAKRQILAEPQPQKRYVAGEVDDDFKIENSLFETDTTTMLNFLNRDDHFEILKNLARDSRFDMIAKGLKAPHTRLEDWSKRDVRSWLQEVGPFAQAFLNDPNLEFDQVPIYMIPSEHGQLLADQRPKIFMSGLGYAAGLFSTSISIAWLLGYSESSFSQMPSLIEILERPLTLGVSALGSSVLFLLNQHSRFSGLRSIVGIIEKSRNICVKSLNGYSGNPIVIQEPDEAPRSVDELKLNLVRALIQGNQNGHEWFATDYMRLAHEGQVDFAVHLYAQHEGLSESDIVDGYFDWPFNKYARAYTCVAAKYGYDFDPEIWDSVARQNEMLANAPKKHVIYNKRAIVFAATAVAYIKYGPEAMCKIANGKFWKDYWT